MLKVQNHPIREAERYWENAKTILSEKAGKEGNYYNDPKYIKMAGNTAWSGVLVALDAVLKVREDKNMKKGQRPDFRDYEEAMAKKDRKMLRTLLAAYESLHKTLGYDGNPSYKIVQESMREGKLVIDWADKHYMN